MTQTIDCADCGHEHEAKRKNARYCDVCRLFRNLIYLGARTSKCASCEAKFAPMHVNDKLCANCDFTTVEARGDCAICSNTAAPLAKPGIAICRYCAKDPSRRDVVTRALGKKRRQRTQETGVAATEAPA